MLHKVLALIDLHNPNNLGLLTENRLEAVTTFLGRYTFIDFMLSNCTNSEIDNIAILCKEKSRSVAKHISRDSIYLKNSKTGFLKILNSETNISNPLFNSDVNNVKENDYILYDNDSEYVIVAPVHFILNIDFNDIIEKHIESNCLCSVVYKVSDDSEMFSNCEKLTIDALGNVQKFEQITSSDKTKFNVNLGIYIFNREFFNRLIKESSNISEIYSIDDLVKYNSKYKINVNTIEFKKDVYCFNSFEKYFKYSMDILDNPTGFLNYDDALIYTTTHNSRPVLYGSSSYVRSSLIANGCTINGTVKHSILARDVVIEDGATVENCILFSHTVVKSGVHLKNVVCNKRVVFNNPQKLEGSLEAPLYIKEGSII